MRVTLLCTFSNESAILEDIQRTKQTYGQHIRSIEVFKYVETPEKFIYIFSTFSQLPRLASTITINKKQQTTTLYTINALNSLIMSLNNGILDKTYRVDWEDYQNTLILAEKPYGCKFIEIEQVDVA